VIKKIMPISGHDFDYLRKAEVVEEGEGETAGFFAPTEVLDPDPDVVRAGAGFEAPGLGGVLAVPGLDGFAGVLAVDFPAAGFAPAFAPAVLATVVGFLMVGLPVTTLAVVVVFVNEGFGCLGDAFSVRSTSISSRSPFSKSPLSGIKITPPASRVNNARTGCPCNITKKATSARPMITSNCPCGPAPSGTLPRITVCPFSRAI
jgi:hypothetical protein